MAFMRRGILGYVQGSLDGLTGRIVKRRNIISKKGDWSQRVSSPKQIAQQLRMTRIMALYSDEWAHFNEYTNYYMPSGKTDWIKFFYWWYPAGADPSTLMCIPQYWSMGIRKTLPLSTPPVYKSDGTITMTWSTSISGGNAAFADVCNYGVLSGADGKFESFNAIRTRVLGGATDQFRPLPVGTTVIFVTAAYNTFLQQTSNATFYTVTVTP